MKGEFHEQDFTSNAQKLFDEVQWGISNANQSSFDDRRGLDHDDIYFTACRRRLRHLSIASFRNAIDSASVASAKRFSIARKNDGAVRAKHPGS